MKICSYCGSECEDTAKICPHCGASGFKNRCPNCGNLFEGNFCPNCGVKVGTKPKKCPNCQTEYFTNACPNCGYMPNRTAPEPQTRSYYAPMPESLKGQTINVRSVPQHYKKECNKWLSLILCLLFGYFGVHKFYEGRYFWGIVYLLTFGLFTFGWLADIFIILFKPNPYYTK